MKHIIGYISGFHCKGLYLFFSLALILALVSTGCRSSTGQPVSSSIPPTTLPPPTTIAPVPSSTAPAATVDRSQIENAAQVISALKGYYLERSVKFSKAMSAGGPNPSSSTIASQQALDLAGHNMRMENAINIKVTSGQAAWPLLHNSIYIIGDKMYIQGLFPDKLDLWSKTDVTPEYWRAQNQAMLLVEMLKASDYTVLPSESILRNDISVPCSVYQAKPDYQKLWELVVSQPGIQLPATAPPGVSFDQIIQSADFKLWLETGTLLPIKAQVNTHIQITPEQLSSLTAVVDMDISILYSFHDYNQEIPISLPEDAQNAGDLNLHKLEQTPVPTGSPAPKP